MPIATANLNIGTVFENTVSGTTLAATYPTQRRNRSDDVYILGFSVGTAAVPSDPAGWTNIGKLSGTGNTLLPGTWLGYKKAVDGDTGSFNITTANAVSWGQIVGCPDIDLINILDASGTTKDQSTAQTTITQTSLSSVSFGALFWSLAADNATGHNASIDSSYVEVGDRVAGTRVAELAYLLAAAAGASAPIITFTGSAKSVGIMGVLKPGPPRAGHFFG